MSVIPLYLIFSMLAVLWFDITRYLIPNWLVASLIALYPLAVYLAPVGVDWKMALVGMLAVLLVGYIIFAKHWMGGGDIKLMVALSLWAGWKSLPDLLFLIALLGGIFAALIWAVRKALPYLPLNIASAPRILRSGEPIPYGVAIALSFLWMMAMGQILLASLPR